MSRIMFNTMDVTHLTLFENMEGRERKEMADRMVIPPLHCFSRRPLQRAAVQMFIKRMVRNSRLPYTYSHTASSRNETFVVADPTHNKKGLFPKTCANRYCVKHLRSRTILVFNVEWIQPSPEVKTEAE